MGQVIEYWYDWGHNRERWGRKLDLANTWKVLSCGVILNLDFVPLWQGQTFDATLSHFVRAILSYFHRTLLLRQPTYV